MIKLSFIIPVFNCEKYISECIGSIYRQNLNHEEFEVIIINDGSTDNSEKIILEFEDQYENIIYIKQNNQGVSRTRNYGLKIAKGKYIQFIDSDDYLEHNVIDKVLTTAITNNLQIITFNKNNTGNNSKKLSNITTGVEYIGLYNYHNYAWHYMFEREFINKICLEFIPDILCEDSLFTMELFLNAKRMANMDIVTYNYRINPVGIMKNQDMNHKLKMIQDYYFIINHIEKIITNYQYLMTDECKGRCRNRQNTFIFFLLIRLLRANQPIKYVKDILNNLRIGNFYPCKRLDKKEYPGIHWNILHTILNQKYIYLSACKLYQLIYGK